MLTVHLPNTTPLCPAGQAQGASGMLPMHRCYSWSAHLALQTLLLAVLHAAPAQQATTACALRTMLTAVLPNCCPVQVAGSQYTMQ